MPATMAAPTFLLLLLCIILVLNAAAGAGAAAALQLGKGKSQAALFVFGDSLFDAGNNDYINTTTEFLCNFRPYGESFFDTPTGRCTDGRTIVDFIAEFAGLPLLEPYLKPGSNQDFAYGTNFASGGAGALVETHSGTVVNMQAQIGNFKDVTKKLRKKLGDNKAEEVISNAVYVLSFGSNDYTTITTLNEALYQSYTQDQYVEMIVGNLTMSIKDIYEMGGRKFGFLTMPPVGCFPCRRVEEPGYNCNDEMNSLTEMHNQKLYRNLVELENQLSGFTYSTFEAATAMTDRMNNPQKYGFKKGITACCGSGTNNGKFSCGGMRGTTEYNLCDNPSEYLFFDSCHFNEVAYRQYAELFWHGDLNTVAPNNLKTFFQGSMNEDTEQLLIDE